MMNCRDAQELLPDYALGLLAEPEQRLVAGHLESGCEACQRELDGVEEALGMLVDCEPLLTPPPRLKEALFAEIDDRTVGVVYDKDAASKKATGRSNRYTRMLPYLAAGVAAVAVGVGTLRWIENGVTGDAALQAWREQIANIDHEIGANDARLVSLQFQTSDQPVLTDLLYDELSSQLHVWALGNAPGGGEAPNHVWVTGADGVVLAHAPLVESGRRLSAVLDITELHGGDPVELVLTHEPDSPGAMPSGPVVERATLKMK